MSDETLVYRIRDWDQQFETRGSRRHQRPLAKISLSTSLEGLVLRRLLSDPQGAAAYGVWVLLLQIAAKLPHRGVLADSTGVYTPPDLALLTGVPESQVQAALELLCSPRIGLLEQLPLELALRPITAPTLPAVPRIVDEKTASDQVANPVADPAGDASPAERPSLDPITRPPDLAPSPPMPSTVTPVGVQRLPDRLARVTFGVPEYEEFQKLAKDFVKTAKPVQPA